MTAPAFPRTVRYAALAPDPLKGFLEGLAVSPETALVNSDHQMIKKRNEGMARCFFWSKPLKHRIGVIAAV